MLQETKGGCWYTQNSQKSNLSQNEAEPQKHENAHNVQAYWNVHARKQAQLGALPRIHGQSQRVTLVVGRWRHGGLVFGNEGEMQQCDYHTMAPFTAACARRSLSAADLET